MGRGGRASARHRFGAPVLWPAESRCVAAFWFWHQWPREWEGLPIQPVGRAGGRAGGRRVRPTPKPTTPAPPPLTPLAPPQVCLSLMGTSQGQKGETWDPAASRLPKVLVSIQALMLVRAGRRWVGGWGGGGEVGWRRRGGGGHPAGRTARPSWAAGRPARPGARCPAPISTSRATRAGGVMRGGQPSSSTGPCGARVEGLGGTGGRRAGCPGAARPFPLRPCQPRPAPHRPAPRVLEPDTPSLPSPTLPSLNTIRYAMREHLRHPTRCFACVAAAHWRAHGGRPRRERQGGRPLDHVNTDLWNASLQRGGLPAIGLPCSRVRNHNGQMCWPWRRATA